MRVLGRSQFIAWIATELALDHNDLAEHTFTELGIDSIQLFEIDLMVEDLGVTLGEEDFARCCRLDEIYDVYVRVATLADRSPS